mgnify:CR=1 FL=1
MVVPRFVKSALENKNLEVYGNGTQSRVFCHVSDAVIATTELLLNENSIGEVYNIGGIGEIQIKDLASKIISHTQSKSSILYVPYEKAYSTGFEDMQKRVPDISKIKNELNWYPQRSIDQIITDVVNFQRQN